MVRGGDGATWRTPPALLGPHLREAFPDGCYDSGVVHGVAGVVAGLAKIAGRADAPVGAAALRDDAARWLRARELADGFSAC